MRLALGMYTTLSSYTPAHAFRRALSLIYTPVLRKLYNSTDIKFTLYNSSGMMAYFDDNHPEVNILISTLCERGSLKLLSGIFTQSILSLSPPKERADSLEKMTTAIRRHYKVRPDGAFFYGQIWAPQYVSTLNSCGIDKVVISSYKATSREHLYDSPFRMNELGKKIEVFPINDVISSAVSRYSQGEMNLSELKDAITAFFENNRSDDVVMFLNLDQLLQGTARTIETEGDDVASIFLHILEMAEKTGTELCHLEDLDVNRNGYLDSGWYGRDAYANSLFSFNDIFVRNGNCRYMKNRLINLTKSVSECKKDKALRRLCTHNISHVTNGPLFIYDPQCGPLRSTERRVFWQNIIEAEKNLGTVFPNLLDNECDLEDQGDQDYISRNGNYTAVFSPWGGSLVEFDYVEKGLNICDTKSHFDKDFSYLDHKRTFADKVTCNGKLYKTKYHKFTTEVVRRNYSEMLFTLDDENLPFSVIKRYKLRNSTLVLESMLVAKEDIDEGSYALNAYLGFDTLYLPSQDHKQLTLLGKLEGIKTLKVVDKECDVQISFTSTDPFTVMEDVKKQSQYTVLGLETFTLYEKFTFSFPFSLKKGESANFRLALRCGENKSKE